MPQAAEFDDTDLTLKLSQNSMSVSYTHLTLPTKA